MSVLFTDAVGRITDAGRLWLQLHSLGCDCPHELGIKLLQSGADGKMLVGSSAQIEDITRRARALGLI